MYRVDANSRPECYFCDFCGRAADAVDFATPEGWTTDRGNDRCPVCGPAPSELPAQREAAKVLRADLNRADPYFTS